MISLLEVEDCFHYHLLLHLGDGKALAVWLGGRPEGESMLAECLVNDFYQMQYAFALLYQNFPIHSYFHSDCPLGGHGSRRERQ
jgi:hypothetical protein